MENLNIWDVVLFAAAAFIAITSLARLMSARRRELVEEVERQWKAERKRRKEQRKKQSRDVA